MQPQRVPEDAPDDADTTEPPSPGFVADSPTPGGGYRLMPAYDAMPSSVSAPAPPAGPETARPAVARPERTRPDTVPLGHGETGRVVGMAVSVTGALAAFDVALTHRLSLFFDLCFVLVGLTAALMVRRRGLFAVAVLPPLLLSAVVAVLALARPAALTSSHLAFVSTWLTGLAHHAAALVAAHVVVLVIVWLRAAQQHR